MIQSPKTRFQSLKGESDALYNLVASDGFIRAVDAALLQMLYETKATANPEEAAAGFHQMTGAMDYVRTLMNLADRPKDSPKAADPNLNFRA